MKKTAITIVATALAVLAGCVAPPKQITLQSEFDADEARRLLAKGDNTIKGSALMRQLDGDVVTCAGREVLLQPATTYAHEVVAHMFGSETKGLATWRPAGTWGTLDYPATWGNVYFPNEASGFWALDKRTTCDAQGFFEFTDVADGSFFVLTIVQWTALDVQQGGAMMQKVEVKGGETKKIVLAP
ncbi:MAG: hypothetical protein MPK09_08630 [Gammaproteobacteria bacterium]|nr:hypothetical protein [Gammaproteobacteria bacterium]MDA8015653.1 hypothetical protein [Gammaproteobacteria bacterium]